jgi:hypothetical protein
VGLVLRDMSDAESWMKFLGVSAVQLSERTETHTITEHSHRRYLDASRSSWLRTNQDSAHTDIPLDGSRSLNRSSARSTTWSMVGLRLLRARTNWLDAPVYSTQGRGSNRPARRCWHGCHAAATLATRVLGLLQVWPSRARR